MTIVNQINKGKKNSHTVEIWFNDNICLTASVCLAKRLFSRQSFIDMMTSILFQILTLFACKIFNVLVGGGAGDVELLNSKM